MAVFLYQAIPQLLAAAGVRHVFGLLGGTNVNWVANGVEAGLFEFVHTRHEESAVQAATGYARATGAIGVATVAKGPGFANAASGLIAATRSHVPLLLLVGESPTTPTKTSYNEQNVPQREITVAIGADFLHISSAAEIEEAFWSCVDTTMQYGRPQVLSADTRKLGGDAVPPLTTRTCSVIRAVPNPADIEYVVDALARARRPLLLAGQGAMVADAGGAITALAQLTGAFTATTLRAHRLFSGQPQDLGLCGTWSAPNVRDLLASVDLVVSFGASLNHHTTDFEAIFGGCSVIPIEVEPNTTVMLSSVKDVVIGDARLAAEAISRSWVARETARKLPQSHVPDARARRESVLAVDIGHDAARGLDPRRVAAIMDDRLPPDRVVLTDSGMTVATTAAIVDARDARSWFNGNSYGCVGLGLGTAIGIATANPDRQVVLFCGDGGFMMASAALDVFRQYPIDLTVIIYNDQQAGSEIKDLKRFDQDTGIIKQELPDIPNLAAAFGGRGAVVRSEADCWNVDIRKGGLNIIDARIDPHIDGRNALA